MTLVGSVANLVGSWVAYGVGYYGRVDIIEKHGHKVFIKPHHLVVADRWFERHGDATVFFTRMLPIVRTFISLPAGVARMPFIRFSVLTFLGCLPWVFMLTFIGQQVGENWTDWKDSLHYFDYFVAVCIIVGVVYLVVKWRRGGGGDAGGRRRPSRRPMPRADDPRLRTRDAIALGLLHGPAELLPVSSSGHVAVVPWLCGWPYSRLDGELRKAFEVALHAGTAAALLVGLRDEVGEAARELDRRRIELVVLSFVPPAIVGFVARAPDRAAARHAGDGRRRPRRRLAGDGRGGRGEQRRAAARGRRRARRALPRPRSGLRAHARRLAQRRDARRRPRARLRARGRERALTPRRAADHRRGDGAEGHAADAPRPAAGTARAFVAGIVASFATTLLSIRIIRHVERDRSPMPYAAYRLGAGRARRSRACGGPRVSPARARLGSSLERAGSPS